MSYRPFGVFFLQVSVFSILNVFYYTYVQGDRAAEHSYHSLKLGQQSTHIPHVANKQRKFNYKKNCLYVINLLLKMLVIVFLLSLLNKRSY